MQSVGALTRAGWRREGAEEQSGGAGAAGVHRRRREAEAAIDEAWTRLAPPPSAASLIVNSDAVPSCLRLPSQLLHWMSRQQTYAMPATKLLT